MTLPSVPVPAAMPSVEEIARVIDPESFGLPTPYVGDNWLTDRDEARAKAQVLLGFFAPILAEKEREIERLRYMFTEQRAQYEADRAAEDKCAKLLAAAIRAQGE